MIHSLSAISRIASSSHWPTVLSSALARWSLSQLGLRDQFQEERFEVRQPLLLCKPATKIYDDKVFDIRNKEATLMWLSARPRDGERVEELARTLSQFSPEQLKTVQERQLCVPSKKHHPVPQQLSSSSLDERYVG